MIDLLVTIASGFAFLIFLGVVGWLLEIPFRIWRYFRGGEK